VGVGFMAACLCSWFWRSWVSGLADFCWLQMEEWRVEKVGGHVKVICPGDDSILLLL
jgi:hypothetical protein